MLAKLSYSKLLIYVSLLILLMAGIHLLINGTDEDAIRFLISYSAKLSAFFFSIAFSASSISYFFNCNLSRSLLNYRPQLGLTFGVFHTFHLGFLIWLQSAIHPVFTLAKSSSLIGGGMAYVFMYLMMLTTFPSIRSRLKTKTWKALHLVGGYWIWFIFVKTYWRKVSIQNEGLFIFALLIIVLVIRVIYYIKAKSLKSKFE